MKMKIILKLIKFLNYNQKKVKLIMNQLIIKLFKIKTLLLNNKVKI